MIFYFKDKKISNSLSVFNYYKALTGRGLDGDIAALQRQEKTEGGGNDVIDAESSPLEIVQFIYYSMRCAAEKKELELSEVVDEVDVTDLADGSLQKAIMLLVEVKKKETDTAKRRVFLGRKK